MAQLLAVIVLTRSYVRKAAVTNEAATMDVRACLRKTG